VRLGMCGMLLQLCEMRTVANSLIVCQIFVLGWRKAVTVWDINEQRKFSMNAAVSPSPSLIVTVSTHFPDV